MVQSSFGDLIGKIGVLRIECAKCGRSGSYMLARLIAKYGRDEKLFTWTRDAPVTPTGDCQSVSERLADSNQTWRQVRNPAQKATFAECELVHATCPDRVTVLTIAGA